MSEWLEMSDQSKKQRRKKAANGISGINNNKIRKKTEVCFNCGFQLLALFD